MGAECPFTNLLYSDLVFYHSGFIGRDDKDQPLKRFCRGYLVFYLLLPPGLYVHFVVAGEISRVLCNPGLLTRFFPCFGTWCAAA